jgi:ATP-binding cassette, subfamily C (CFTR/MRP), member 1
MWTGKVLTQTEFQGNSPSLLSPVVTFGLAILVWSFTSHQTLSISRVFTSLAIITLLSEPLARLLNTVPGVVASMSCLERIQKLLEEAQESADGRRPPSDEHLGIGTGRTVVMARDVSFAAKAGEEPILKHISMDILLSTFTIVLGKVGSGKSTLLRGMLREIYCAGLLRTPSEGAAFCAETPWLVNSNIKQNILGQSEFERGWYDTVVAACDLDLDFEQLLMGDESVVGSKGLSLSGGQKQRIASRFFVGMMKAPAKRPCTDGFPGFGTCYIFQETCLHSRRCLEWIGREDSTAGLGTGFWSVWPAPPE